MTIDTVTISDWVRDARQRTIDLVADLDDVQIMGPRLDIINPLLWEIGHVAWFSEKWILRESLGRDPILSHADALWDSIAIAHDLRWNLPLPTREKTLEYLAHVRDDIMEVLEGKISDELLYRTQYCVFHEDMHTEAFTYSRQTLGYPPPPLSGVAADIVTDSRDGPSGDVEISSGTFMLGASKDAPFVFDNEMWEHPVEVKPFAIARVAVTQSEFAEFVGDEGYERTAFWSPEGWRWKMAARATHPVYWKRDSNEWLRRDFDRWVPLEPHRAVIHVNWHEANAYCRWAHRRLPTEAEWEIAASTDGRLEPGRKRRFPWGDDDATGTRVNMDWRSMGCVDVGTKAAGDSPSGCRQLIGNVWEWTSDAFRPYEGFRPDFYKEYSEPWFGTRKVLRGGSWATRSRMLRNTWRNFYEPHRRDVLAGFRTCAVTA